MAPVTEPGLDLTRGRVQRWARHHLLVVDGLLAAAILVTSPAIMPGQLTGQFTETHGAIGVVVFLGSALQAAACFVRRRHPAAFAVAVSLIAILTWPVVQAFALVPLAAGGYALALWARPLAGAGIIGGTAAVTFLEALLVNPVIVTERSIDALNWLNAMIAMGVGAALGLAARRNLAHEAELRRRTQEYSALRSTVAVDLERRAVAADLHDVVSHTITVMVNLCDGALAARTAAPDRAWHAIEAAAGAGRSASAEMTTLVAALRSADMLPLDPTPENLTDVVARIEAAGLAVEMRGDATWPTDPVVAGTVRRVVLESLTNVLKHAVNPTHATVTTTTIGDWVDVVITDDGQPPPSHGPRRTAATSGFGLLGLHERVALVGGELVAGPGPHGWQVSARIPRHADGAHQSGSADRVHVPVHD